jgi:hypothetical protein
VKKAQIIATFLALFLSVGFLSPAYGDQLSDEKAKLVVLQNNFDSINGPYQNAVRSLPKLAIVVSRLDPAKDAAQIAIYNAQIASFEAAVTTFGPQVEPARAALEAQTIIVNQLDTATNFGKNCPATWGVTAEETAVNIDKGIFNFVQKIGTQVTAEPRNIVVTAKTEYSTDGVSWNERNIFSYNQYIGVFNSPKYPAGFSRNVMTDPYSLAELGQIKMRVVTTMAKEGCETVVLNSNPVTVIGSIAPTEKIDLDLLYATYLPGIPNYQSRDRLKAVVARVKSELPVAIAAGNNFYLNDGETDSSTVILKALTPGCNGGLNSIIPKAGENCSVAIYWIGNNVWKLVDSVSALGGLSEAAKQAAQLQTDIQSLKAQLLSNTNAVVAASGQLNEYINTFYKNPDNTVNAAFLTQVQTVANQISALYAINQGFQQKYKSLWSPQFNPTDQYWQVIKSNDLGQSLNDGSQVSDSAHNAAQDFLRVVSEKVSQASGESTAALKYSQATINGMVSVLKQLVENVNFVTKSLTQGSLVVKNMTDYYAILAKYTPDSEKYRATRAEYQSRLDVAIKMASMKASAAEIKNWSTSVENYKEVMMYMRKLDDYHNILETKLKESLAKSGNSEETIDSDGEEEGPTGSVEVVREKTGKYLIKISTDQESSAVVVRATRKGSKTVVFRATTNQTGSINIRTTRKLAGWTVTLFANNEVLGSDRQIQ